MATEGPEYTVEKKDGRFELRHYDGYIVAQVEVAADFRDAINAGFNVLAGYIFGNNQSRRDPSRASGEEVSMTAPITAEKIPMATPVTSEKIPMTAPVSSERLSMTAPVSAEKKGDERYRISFVMPSSYTLETLPVPGDSRISFRQMGTHRAAVVTFSGWLTDDRKALKKADELKAWIAREGLTPRSEYVVAQYNSPWTPGPLRRNEIIVEVE